MFNKIANKEVQQRITSLISQLVAEWDSEVPVSIIEVLDKDLRNIFAMSGMKKKERMKAKERKKENHEGKNNEYGR